MDAPSRSIFASLLLVVTLCTMAWQIQASISGKLDARKVIAPLPTDELSSQIESSETSEPDWLEFENNTCSKTPCLVVEHDTEKVVARLYTHPLGENAEHSTELMSTTIAYESKNGRFTRLYAKRYVTPDLQLNMVQNGVDLKLFRNDVNLYEVSGDWTWTKAEVDLPYGAFSQFVFDGFQKTMEASSVSPDVELLLGYAGVVTTEVNKRFDIATLSDRSRVAMIVAGPTQTFTYTVAILAILFVLLESGRPNLRPYTDGLADLIPFTGFFGTLLGVAGGLRVLGESDVTDDVSKAISLGRIGSSLGFAINTTILAIVVFGLVVLFHYAVRTAVGTRLRNHSQ